MNIKQQLERKYALSYMYDFSGVTTRSLQKKITYTCIDHDEEVTTTAEEALEKLVLCDKCVAEYTIMNEEVVKNLLGKYTHVDITYSNSLELVITCKECGNALKLNKNNEVPNCRSCNKPSYENRVAELTALLYQYPHLTVDKLLLGNRTVKFTCDKHGSSVCGFNHWQAIKEPCSKCVKEAKLKSIEQYKNDYEHRMWAPIRLEPPFVVFDCPIHGEIAGSPKLDIPCPKCARALMKRASRLNYKDWLTRARESHGNRFDYSFGEYLGTIYPMRIHCIEHDTIFWYSAGNHTTISSGGCPECQFSSCGFHQGKPAILYYLRLVNDNYKIGITNKTVQTRYTKKEQEQFTVVKEWYYEYGADALKKEQELLKQFKEHKYSGPPLIESVGITEIFNKDVLGLDQII